MKRTFFTAVFSFLLLLAGFTQTNIFLNVKINTASNSENVKYNYTVEKWNKNSKLVTVSFINNGDKTEYIKDVQIYLNNTSRFNESSSFFYGSYQMGSAPVVKHGIKDSILKTETVLLAKESNSQFFKIGVLSWEIFRLEISYNEEKGIKIYAEGENKPIKPGEKIQFEKFVVEEGDNWQDMLYAYGEQIAKVQMIKPKKIVQFKGWSTWDYYGQRFTEKEISMNIQKIKDLTAEANIIQIDGGWWKFRGDYLDCRSDIDGGMKGVAKMIADNGCTPGLHLDGFRGEMASGVYQAHPDFFLKNENGKTFYSESQRPNRLEQSTYFDYSNPAAREYIKNVLKTIRQEWGFKYFKIDFMAYGINREILKAQKKYGLKEIHAYDSTMTSMERTRAGLKAMREGMGDAFFLGCSSVFGPTFGIVDGLRTGGDIFPNYKSYTTRCLQNGGGFYLHKTVVQNDADYLIVRNKDDEEPERAWKDKFGGDVTLNEAAMWADYVALFSGMHIASDNLNTLRSERKVLVKKAIELKTCDRFIPIDLWDKANDKDDAFNIMLGTNDDGVFIALFNWGNEQLGIKLANIPTAMIQAINCLETPFYRAENNRLDIQLKERSSVIFKLKKGTDFDKLRKKIEYKFSK